MKLKLFYLFTYITTSLFAQLQPSCRVTTENNKVFQNHPEALIEYQEFNKYSRRFNEEVRTSNASTYTIPVVFHVYGTSFSGQTVTQAKIRTALEKTNEDFKGWNTDFSSVDPMFASRRGTVDIEFKLAKIDPNGGCTTGVIFHSKKSGFGNGGGYDEEVQADAWDNYKYMNVYIQSDLYDDGATSNSGVGWYPNTWMSDNNLARVVYNGAYLYGNTSDEFASVLTHEFGHWLNLIHTFEGGCSGTDEVDDTPNEDGTHGLGCTAGTNCFGDYVNSENYMGYNGAAGCYKMFTMGQITRLTAALSHPTRQPLWQYGNLIATGVHESLTGNTITSDATLFKEADANNGSFIKTSIITVSGTTFTSSSGYLTAGTDYNAFLPSGLSASIILLSSTQAQLSLIGSAISHTAVNNTNGIITFYNSAITGGVGMLNCDDINLDIEFYDPYDIFYVDNEDILVNTEDTWKWFNIEGAADNTSFGAYVNTPDNDKLNLITYGKKLIGNNGTINITRLGFGEAINATRNFIGEPTYPDYLTLMSPTYTTWDGQSGYIGFEYEIDSRTCYGWFHVVVFPDGGSYIITDYAYNTQPNSTIYTPSSVLGNLIAESSEIREADVNDGSFTATAKIILADGTFTTSSGTLTEGVDFTASLPSGLTANVTLLNNKQAEVTLIGSAANHANSDDVTGNITFLSGIITGGVSALNTPTVTWLIDYYDPYDIFYVDNDDISVDAGDTWEWFQIDPDADSRDFGAFIEGGTLKIEAYYKRMICNGNTQNITVLGFDEPVDVTRNFVASGDYPDLLNLSGAGYTAWNGQSKYAGFEYTIDGRICYGWFHIEVSVDGSSYKIVDYGYNTEPGGTIYTPSNLSVGDDVYNSNEFIVYPNPFNNKVEIANNGVGYTKLNVEIFNSLGQKVFGNNYSDFDRIITIPKLEIAKGVYFIKILSGNKTVSVKQLIKK